MSYIELTPRCMIGVTPLLPRGHRGRASIGFEKKVKIMNIKWNEDDEDEVKLLKARFVQKLHPSRHKNFDRFDIEACMETLAMEEGDLALKFFDHTLDPFEMYYLSPCGTPHRISANISWYTEAGIGRVIEDTCTAFAEFSNWRNVRELPEDWRERREEIESQNDLRQSLMAHLNERVMDYCCTESYRIFVWRSNRALTRWKMVRNHVNIRMLAFYWFEIGQRRYYDVNGLIRQHDISNFTKEFVGAN